MNAKGNFSEVVEWIVALAITGIILFALFNAGSITKEDSTINKAFSAMKGFGDRMISKFGFGAASFTNGLIENPITCEEGQDRSRNIEVIRSIAESTSNPNIDPDFALAIMWGESNLYHCRDGKIVENPSPDEDSIGIAQVNRDYWGDQCPDLTSLQGNIQCSIMIMQTEMRKMQGMSRDEYYEWIKCNDEELKKTYESYYGDINKMTARAYNGAGCPETEINGRTVLVGKGYVEKIMDNMQEKPWQDI